MKPYDVYLCGFAFFTQHDSLETHPAHCINSPLLLLAFQGTRALPTVCLTTHSSTEGHLDVSRFELLWTELQWTFMHVFLYGCKFVFVCDKCSGVWLLSRNCLFPFVRNCYPLLQSGHGILHCPKPKRLKWGPVWKCVQILLDIKCSVKIKLL